MGACAAEQPLVWPNRRRPFLQIVESEGGHNDRSPQCQERKGKFNDEVITQGENNSARFISLLFTVLEL